MWRGQALSPRDAELEAGERVPQSTFAGDILVVDDAPENLIAIEAALSDLGGELVKATCGHEALRHLLDREFALILLDVKMPDMDGFETARLIRQRSRTRHVPIIFVTGYGGADYDVLQAYKLGAVDFLQKPIEAEILRAKAAVFVELQRRTAQVAQQSALLREHERRNHESALAEQRQKLEELALRKRLDEQQEHAEQLARKARELAQTVADRERAEAELKIMNAKLAEDDRRKDEFLALLGHELRNPMAPLVAGLELLELTGLDDPEQQKAHATMTRQVHHLVRLVDDLLDISRITSGKITLERELLDLCDILAQAVSMSEPLLASRKHEFKAALPEAEVLVRGDAVRLAQVVSNLLNNAARYTDPGGRVSLETELADDSVVVRVIDNGRGMDDELIARAFDTFTQGEAAHGGLGLGLTLVRRLTEMHGGEVHAESDGLGKGSVLTIRLPMAEKGDQNVARRTTNGVSDASENLRIVLIEDNDDIRELMQKVLQRWGHSVSAAATGQSGLDLIVSERPDLAFVDVGLPDFDGYTVAERVHAAFPEECPRLVALTGFSQEKDLHRAREAGFHSHIAKPASKESLRRVLHK